VYSTNRVSEGGRESGLKDLLREWRLAGKGEKKSKAVKTKPPSTSATVPNATPRVGTDEAGKGEYFGPLVVAGIRVSGEKADSELRSLGVRDSKDLGLATVRKLAPEIHELLGEQNIRVACLPPREYETRRRAAKENVNRLLGEMNAAIIDELGSQVEVAVVDAFGTKAAEYVEASLSSDVKVEARPRAEDDAAVAAASIVARARYLEEMDRLSEKVGVELPRGSTHVIEVARRVFEERGEDGLRDVAKVHFSITDKVLG
jgi:ribonuclease HIII